MLAWLAEVSLGRGTMTVWHGHGIERTAAWFVEGCWDGPFEAGGFPESEAFFGSGGRVSGGTICFAASTSLTDRLFWSQGDTVLLCSNSLPLILAAMGDELDEGHDYEVESHAIIRGIHAYDRGFHVCGQGELSLCQLYAGNLVVSGGRVFTSPRSSPVSFHSYEDYLERLTATLSAIADNYRSPSRRFPVRAYTTVSSGYDSVAVSALTRELGVAAAFTTTPSCTGWEDGRSVSLALGLEPIELTPVASDAETELLSLAATCDGRESALGQALKNAQSDASCAVVFTGYHGDKLWDRHVAAGYLGDDVLRGDTSGLNLSEVRLATGFANVAVPFIFARGIGDLVRISNSPDMRPWQVDTGYDRPIARRIAEERGVPRQAFGQRKRVIFEYYPYPKNAQLRMAFHHYLRTRSAFGTGHRLLHSVCALLDYRYEVLTQKMAFKLPLLNGGLKGRFFGGEASLENRLFVWAVNQVSDRYRHELAREPEAISGNG